MLITFCVRRYNLHCPLIGPIMFLFNSNNLGSLRHRNIFSLSLNKIWNRFPQNDPFDLFVLLILIMLTGLYVVHILTKSIHKWKEMKNINSTNVLKNLIILIQFDSYIKYKCIQYINILDSRQATVKIHFHRTETKSKRCSYSRFCSEIIFIFKVMKSKEIVLREPKELDYFVFECSALKASGWTIWIPTQVRGRVEDSLSLKDFVWWKFSSLKIP